VQKSNDSVYYTGTVFVVSNTFTIDQGILEKTLEFAPGE
jgi:hypothetical protein